MTEQRAARGVAFLVAITGLLVACGSSSSPSGGGGSSTSAASSSSSVGPGSAFCTDAKTFSDQTAKLNGLGSAATLDQLKKTIGDSVGAIDALDSEAPADIASDLHAFRAAFDALNAQIQAATSLGEVKQIVSTAPKLSTEQGHLESFIQSQCGFIPTGGGGAAATPGAPAQGAPTP